MIGSAVALAEVTCDADWTKSATVKRGDMIILGEVHGTNESPQFLSALACEVAVRRKIPLVVALEMPSDQIERLKEFIETGSDDSRRALLSAGNWTKSQDGRSSKAALVMLSRLHEYRASGADISVVPIDVPLRAPPGNSVDDVIKARAKWMARNMKDAYRADAVNMALVGNVHASLDGNSFQGTVGSFAKELDVPNRRSYRIKFESGTAWSCMADGCGAHDFSTLSNTPEGQLVGLQEDDRLKPRYDGYYFVGKTITASEPAVPPK